MTNLQYAQVDEHCCNTQKLKLTNTKAVKDMQFIFYLSTSGFDKFFFHYFSIRLAVT